MVLCCVWWTGWTVSQQGRVKVSTGLFSIQLHQTFTLTTIGYKSFFFFLSCPDIHTKDLPLSVPLSLTVIYSLRASSVHSVDWRFGKRRPGSLPDCPSLLLSSFSTPQTVSTELTLQRSKNVPVCCFSLSQMIGSNQTLKCLVQS